jgi:tetratricopeptide (TPR) repeat protein
MRWLRLLIVSLVLATSPATAIEAESPELQAAVALYTARRDAEAQVAFERLVQTDAHNHAALYYLARLAKRKNDWTRASEFYERCVALAPGNAVYWSDLGEAYGKLANRAGILHQLGFARKCRNALAKSIELDPANIDYRLGLVEFYQQAPVIAGGSMAKAYAEVAEIRRRDPYAGALANGNLLLSEQKWAEAEQAYKEAARYQPDSLDPPFALGQLDAQLGRYEEAFGIFEDLLAKNQDNFGALYQIGRIAALSGQRLDRGESVLRLYLSQPQRASKLPSHAWANFRLGEVLAKKGDPAGARGAWEAALQLDPGLKNAAQALKNLK